MRRAISHFLTSTWIGQSCAIFFWLLIGAMTAQMVVPPQLVAFHLVADQEQSEEEESEPAEVPGEEELPQFCGAAPCRLRRPDAEPRQQLAGEPTRVSTRSIGRSRIPAELACRNGTGGPLRC